nr:hypothetical protein [Tanacetum cinerariifolium]
MSSKMVSSKTQWCKFVPIKVNILSWRIKLNNLHTRLNLSRRGLELQTILCPSCNLAVESTDHLFFSCSKMKDLYASIAKWWDVNMPEFSSFKEWWEWFSNFRLSSKLKMLLEGVFNVAWWFAWNFDNKSIFGPNIPLKARLFDDVVAFSLSWCRSRSKFNFNRYWCRSRHYVNSELDCPSWRESSEIFRKHRGAKFDIEKFDETGDFGLWRVKIHVLFIQHGCEAALEVLPTDIKVEAKTELNKKAHSVVTLCLSNKLLREVIGEMTTTGVWTKLDTFIIRTLCGTLLYGRNALSLEDRLRVNPNNDNTTSTASSSWNENDDGVKDVFRPYTRAMVVI